MFQQLNDAQEQPLSGKRSVHSLEKDVFFHYDDRKLQTQSEMLLSRTHPATL